MNVGFILTFFPHSLDGLIYILIFDIGHFCDIFGTLDSSVRHNSQHLWVRKGRRCLSHYHRWTATYLRSTQIPFQFLHSPGKIVRGPWSMITYTAFQVNTPTLDVGIIFGFLNLGIVLCLLVPILYWIGCLSLAFLSWSLWFTPFRLSGWFILYHPPRPLNILILNLQVECCNILTVFQQ